MGVMQCDRLKCESILCDRYSSDFGYICSDCFDELVQLGEVRVERVEAFMNSPKRVYRPEPVDVYGILNKIFPGV